MVNYNGDIVEETALSRLLENRGLHYGDALFETMRMAAGRIFFWEDHCNRLLNSLEILQFRIPDFFSKNFLKKEVVKTVPETKGSYRIKILVWRKPGGKYTPENHGLEYAIFAEPLQYSLYPKPAETFSVGFYTGHFIASGILSTLKTTDKILHVLAGIYAQQNGYDSCLIFNEKREVIEAGSANIFLVSGNSIKTPSPESGCLNGIMRRQILKIIRTETDYEVTEESVFEADIRAADELFLTNSISGIIPVTRCEEKEFQKRISLDLSARLNRIAADFIS